jgi:hypothetical protein
MTKTLDRAVKDLAESALLKGRGFELNADGHQAVEALKSTFDLVASYETPAQAQEKEHSVDLSPSMLYAASLVVKANEQGVKAASLKAFLDFFDMHAKPEELEGICQTNRKIMFSAAKAMKNI